MYGYKPAWLINIDTAGNFGWVTDSTTQMDSYWVYCFNGKDNFNGCYYVPDFQNYGKNFDSSSWSTWLSNKDSISYIKKNI